MRIREAVPAPNRVSIEAESLVIRSSGDMASFVQDGEELPMLAPPAMQQARHLGNNLLRDLAGRPVLPFRHRDKGIMAKTGQRAWEGFAARADSGPGNRSTGFSRGRTSLKVSRTVSGRGKAPSSRGGRERGSIP